MNYKSNIQNAKLSIYDPINPLDDNFYIPTQQLQYMLERSLIGTSVSGLPLRRRSKFVKTLICESLGYNVPKTFKRTKPRFMGQNFDVYTQKSLNVQIWNEELDANRRYVFIRINDLDIITAVKIITGKELTKYDKTGTLTRKYQASMIHQDSNFCSDTDSDNIQNWLIPNDNVSLSNSPNALPTADELLSIQTIFERLKSLVGTHINYLNATQERNRGAILHELICSNLGYGTYEDDGSYPDIKNQLLEIKLQTSPTIDLGLHSPTDKELILSLDNKHFYSEDIRYAIFDAEFIGDSVQLNKLYVVSGKEFPSVFPLFKGKVTNSKIQLSLPKDFFKN